MATASLTLSGDTPLVFSGANGTDFGLVSLQLPVFVPRTSYAPAGRWMHGLVPSAAVWEHTSIGATVIIQGSTQSNLATNRAAVKAALGRMSYTATVMENAVEQDFSADWGSMALAEEILLPHLVNLYEVYRLTIPVHPTVVPA